MPFAGTESNLMRLYQKIGVVLPEVDKSISAGVMESAACTYVERRFVCHFLTVQHMLSNVAASAKYVLLAVGCALCVIIFVSMDCIPRYHT